MEINKLILLFGKEYKNNELIEICKEDNFDIIKNVQEWMESDYYEDSESDVYAENFKNGYSLYFEDELYFLDIQNGEYGESGNYYFTCIFLYIQKNDEYNSFKSELPFNIKVNDTKEIIRKKLGTNYKRHDFLNEDIWEDFDKYELFVTYDNNDKLQTITIQMLEKYKIIENKTNHNQITLSQLTDIIQWSGLKSIEEYNTTLSDICKSEKYNQYKYLFEDIQKSLSDENTKNINLPQDLVSDILDTLGMVVFKRTASNTLSSLSYEFGENAIRLAHEWAMYIRQNGWEDVLNYHYEDETILKTSDALVQYGYDKINRLYERTNISLND